MRALCSPSRSGNPDRGRTRAVWLSAVLPVMLFGFALPVAAEESAAVWSVWKVKEVHFSYRSTVAIYSCRALQERVVSILRAIGARDDLEVTVTSCDTLPSPMTTASATNSAWPDSTNRLFQPRATDRMQHADRGQSANVHVRLLMPAEVTPEVVVELEKDQSRRELVSRVTRDPSASRNIPLVFPAQWQSVTLSRDSIGLRPEECELLEQMSTSVLRELDVRVVSRRHNCDPNRVSRIPPQLTAEVLMGTQFGGTPFGTGTPAQMPGASEGDPDPAPAASDPEPAESATATPPTPG